MKIETGEKNKILRNASKLVDVFDKKLAKFLVDMHETMEKNDGIGLSAPQVGRNERIIVCLLFSNTDSPRIVDMINPEITERSLDTEIQEEGCLSLPGVFKNVARNENVTVKFLDKSGKEQVLNLGHLDAAIVQHEIDHLDGILFIDRVVQQSTSTNVLMG